MTPRQQRLNELTTARDQLNQRIARMQRTEWATTQQTLHDLYRHGIHHIRHNDYAPKETAA